MKRLSTFSWSIKVFLALIGLLLLSAPVAKADPTLKGTGSGGSWTGSGFGLDGTTPLSASATFSVSGSTLTIVLSNTSTFSGSYVPSDILTAVAFNQGTSNAGITLTPSSASANSLIQGPLPVGANGSPNPGGPTTIGDYYEYLSGISTSTWPGATQGISTAGFNIFGQGNFGSNGQNVDGYGEGIVGPNYTTGNDGIPTTPLVQSTMTFNLTVSGGTFDLANITNVFFQYGTTLEGPNTNVVPEPSTIAIAGLGALGFVAYGLRRRLKK